MNREDAWALLTQYNEGEFHRKHARIVGDVMRYFARELGYGDEEEFWEVVGILHDLDYERYPEQHCIRGPKIMREHGVDERTIRACASHCYGTPWTLRPNTKWKRCSSPRMN